MPPRTDNAADALGWLFFDGDCPLCREAARRFSRVLARRQFHLQPLQSPGAASGGAWAVLVAPLGCLFPPVFVRNVILPMLQALGATGTLP